MVETSDKYEEFVAAVRTTGEEFESKKRQGIAINWEPRKWAEYMLKIFTFPTFNCQTLTHQHELIIRVISGASYPSVYEAKFPGVGQLREIPHLKKKDIPVDAWRKKVLDADFDRKRQEKLDELEEEKLSDNALEEQCRTSLAQLGDYVSASRLFQNTTDLLTDHNGFEKLRGQPELAASLATVAEMINDAKNGGIKRTPAVNYLPDYHKFARACGEAFHVLYRTLYGQRVTAGESRQREERMAGNDDDGSLSDVQRPRSRRTGSAHEPIPRNGSGSQASVAGRAGHPLHSPPRHPTRRPPPVEPLHFESGLDVHKRVKSEYPEYFPHGLGES